MSRIDIMTDIETLGVSNGTAVFQVSALSFNIRTGEVYSSFNKIIDIETIPNIKVDASTIKWWLKTDSELFNKLINNELSEDFSTVIADFYSWINYQSEDIRDIYLWANGILFDCAKIKDLFESNNLKYPIFYRNDRDMRTIVELAQVKEGLSLDEFKAKFEDDSLKKHDAFDDCRWQIKVVSYCWNLLTK